MTTDEFNVLSTVVGFLLRLGAAVLIFFIGRWLAGRARTWLHISLPKANVPPSMSQLAERGAYYGILFVAILTGLALVGVPSRRCWARRSSLWLSWALPCSNPSLT